MSTADDSGPRPITGSILALGGIAAVLGSGWALTAGLSWYAEQGSVGGEIAALIGTGLAAAGALCAIAAVVLLARAMWAAAGRGMPGVAAAAAVVAAAGVGAFAMVTYPMLPAAAALLVPVWVIGAAVRAGGRPAGARSLPVAVAMSAGLVVVTAFTVLHIVFWNPLARVPGLSLTRIYAEMEASGQWSPAGSIVIVVWAAASVLAAAWLVVAAAARRLSPLAVVVIGLGLIGAVCATSVLASFGLGMALADTFATGGADAALTGAAVHVMAQLAFAAAIAIGFAPRSAVPARVAV